MKRPAKIIISIVTIIIVIAILCVQFANLFITKMVKSTIDEQLAKISTATISYDDIHLALISRCIVVDDIYFCNKVDPQNGDEGTRIEANIDRLKILFIDAPNFRKEHRILARKIELVEPNISVVSGKKQQKNEEDNTENLIVEQKHPQSLLSEIGAEKVEIKGGKICYSSTEKPLTASGDKIDIKLKDISYDFAKRALKYNEHKYSFDISNIDCALSDGIHKLHISQFAYEDDEAIKLTDVHFWNSAKKEKYADIKGKIPVTWVDVEANSIETSPIELVNGFMRSDTITIDQLKIDGKRVVLHRDNRYKAKVPYAMPQERLLSIGKQFCVKQIDTKLSAFNIEVATSNINCGKIDLKNINLTAKNVCNKFNETIETRTVCKLNGGGYGDVTLNLLLNKKSSFNCYAKAANVAGGALNDFTRPLLGLTYNCQIDDLKTQFSGNKKDTKGTFTMLYHDFAVHVYKEETPYAIIAKNSGAINSFAKVVIPPANPANKLAKVRSYNIHYTRNEYKNFTSYIMFTLLDGLKSTLLPGSSIKERIKELPAPKTKTAKTEKATKTTKKNTTPKLGRKNK